MKRTFVAIVMGMALLLTNGAWASDCATEAGSGKPAAPVVPKTVEAVLHVDFAGHKPGSTPVVRTFIYNGKNHTRPMTASTHGAGIEEVTLRHYDGKDILVVHALQGTDGTLTCWIMVAGVKVAPDSTIYEKGDLFCSWHGGFPPENA